MAALIKLASDRGVNLVEIIFWRQLTSIPLMLCWVMATGGLAMLATKRASAHAVRALYGFVGMLCGFGSVMMLPLAEATTLSFTAPLFATILSIILLRDAVGIWRWGAVLAGFAGILIIAQPGSGNLPLLGAAIGLTGAFFVALISIQVADLNRTDRAEGIVFWFSVASTLLALPAMPFFMQPHGQTDILLLLGIGIVGTVGQLLITLALRFGRVASVIVMDYTALFWATLYGWFIWGTLPGPWTWVGAPLIVGAGLLITWRETVLARRDPSDPHPATGT